MSNRTDTPPHSIAMWLIGSTLFAPLCLLILSCRHEPMQTQLSQPKAAAAVVPAVDVRSAHRALSPQEDAAYAGDKACVPCHTTICRLQAGSRHARTMEVVTTNTHGGYFRIAGAVEDPLLGYTYSVAVDSGRCVQKGRSVGGGGSLTADYVLGSGRNAHTYMSRLNDNTWVDLRLSYYTRMHKWDFTPVQRPGDHVWKRAGGIDEIGDRLVDCLLCHVTTLRSASRSTSGGIDAANSHLGIGCERCHGPGRAHIDSFQHPVGGASSASSPAVTKLEDLKHATQQRINDICGGCHRTPISAPPGDPKTENGLARFEGAALPRSACYKDSGTLTCVTCHDPHGDSDVSSQHNDAKCLGCHAKPAIAPVSHGKSAKRCPVNQTSGCVQCHMPAQTIRTIPYATYHNHWIKVWSKKSTSL